MDDFEAFAHRLRSIADDPIAVRNLAGNIQSDDGSLPPFLRRGFKLRSMSANEELREARLEAMDANAGLGILRKTLSDTEFELKEADKQLSRARSELSEQKEYARTWYNRVQVAEAEILALKKRIRDLQSLGIRPRVTPGSPFQRIWFPSSPVPIEWILQRKPEITICDMESDGDEKTRISAALENFELEFQVPRLGRIAGRKGPRGKCPRPGYWSVGYLLGRAG